MSKIVLREKNQTTVRAAALATPIHICLSILDTISDRDNYFEETALKVGNILYVQNAP